MFNLGVGVTNDLVPPCHFFSPLISYSPNRQFRILCTYELLLERDFVFFCEDTLVAFHLGHWVCSVSVFYCISSPYS